MGFFFSQEMFAHLSIKQFAMAIFPSSMQKTFHIQLNVISCPFCIQSSYVFSPPTLGLERDSIKNIQRF